MYKHLCSSQIPVTDELFGGDLHKLMKDISESHRVVGKITRGRGAANMRGQSYGEDDSHGVEVDPTIEVIISHIIRARLF